MVRNVGVQVNGGLVLRPSVLPEIDTSAMVPPAQLLSPPALVIGVSDGGDPGKVYNFRNMGEAKAVIRGGAVISHIARMFRPSPDQNVPGASSIKFIRSSSTAARAYFSIVPPPFFYSIHGLPGLTGVSRTLGFYEVGFGSFGASVWTTTGGTGVHWVDLPQPNGAGLGQAHIHATSAFVYLDAVIPLTGYYTIWRRSVGAAPGAAWDFLTSIVEMKAFLVSAGGMDVSEVVEGVHSLVNYAGDVYFAVSATTTNETQVTYLMHLVAGASGFTFDHRQTGFFAMRVQWTGAGRTAPIAWGSTDAEFLPWGAAIIQCPALSSPFILSPSAGVYWAFDTATTSFWACLNGVSWSAPIAYDGPLNGIPPSGWAMGAMLSSGVALLITSDSFFSGGDPGIRYDGVLFSGDGSDSQFQPDLVQLEDDTILFRGSSTAVLDGGLVDRLPFGFVEQLPDDSVMHYTYQPPA